MASSIVKVPVSGKSTMGNNAVTAIGAASVIHQTIIQTATAITFHAPGFSAVSGLRKMISANNKGPVNKPNILAPVNWGCLNILDFITVR